MKTSKADKYFSLYIRLRDADENGIGTCVTCGLKKHIKGLHCGHFIGRQHQSTRFDEMNGHCQCAGCNTFNEGRKAEYEHYLISRYGEQEVNLLKLRGQSTCKRNKLDLDYLTVYFKGKAVELSREKGIELW